MSSPTAPGVFAISMDYYNAIGGLNTLLFPYGQDSVELSIRVWLCGGMVIRQPCSRVAHSYNHVFEDAIVGNGVTEEQIDRNVMAVAELFVTLDYSRLELLDEAYYERFCLYLILKLCSIIL